MRMCRGSRVTDVSPSREAQSDLPLRQGRQVGLESHAEALAGALSGGEKQRAAVARALTTAPALAAAMTLAHSGPLHVGLPVVLTGVGVSLLAGLVSSAVPAWNASAQDPAEVLRWQ